MEIGSGPQLDLRNGAGQLWLALGLIRNGASNGIDNDVLRAGVIFCRIGVFDTQYIAGALDERVLKASAGAEKRPIASPREFNSLKHSVETLVWAAGGGEDAVEAFKDLLNPGFREVESRNPFGL